MNNILLIKCRYCTIPVDIVLKQMQPRKCIPSEVDRKTLHTLRRDKY
jgi:hypothetical protein